MGSILPLSSSPSLTIKRKRESDEEGTEVQETPTPKKQKLEEVVGKAVEMIKSNPEPKQHMLLGQNLIKQASNSREKLVVANKLGLPGVDLSDSEITDEDLILAESRYHLTLVNCQNITNAGIKSLVNLQALNIAKCYQLGNEAIKSLVKLTSLNISYCQFFTVEVFQSLVNLTVLEISHCPQFKDEDIESLVKFLPELCSFYISHCSQLTDKAIESIKGLKDLTGLNIAGCQFSKEAIKSLIESSKTLKLLLIADNQFTDEDIKSFQELRPELDIMTNTEFSRVYGIIIF